MAVAIDEAVGRALAAASVPDQATLSQVKSSHITQALDARAREIELRYELEKARLRFVPTVTFAVILGSLLGIIALSWLFLAFGKPDALAQVLVPIPTFISGLAGGYGFGRGGNKPAP